MISSAFYKDYYELRKKLDSRISELEQIHSKHMICKNKCSSCCMSFKVLPIEWHAIEEKIGNNHSYKQKENKDDCKFLINESCSIYENRPLICRTQGLPIVHYNEETEIWDLLACELNFTNVSDNYFTEDNCLFMDEYNETLREINQDFLQENKEKIISENVLLDINSL